MSALQDGPTRTLLPDERVRWGWCVICGAGHRWPCDATVDTASYTLLTLSDGAHRRRIEQAPRVVREVAVS